MTPTRTHAFRALLVTALMAAASGTAWAQGRPGLQLESPFERDGLLVVEFSLRGLFDEEIGSALESGLPATLDVVWQLWRRKSTWWDGHVDSGHLSYRIFFDVLEERFDVFDERGRRIATCQTLTEVESAVAKRRELELIDMARLRSSHWYYLEMEARLATLDVQEIRDLEGWFRGGIREGRRPGLLEGISEHAVAMLKNAVGLGERRVWAKSDPFRGSD